MQCSLRRGKASRVLRHVPLRVLGEAAEQRGVRRYVGGCVHAGATLFALRMRGNVAVVVNNMKDVNSRRAWEAALLRWVRPNEFRVIHNCVDHCRYIWSVWCESVSTHDALY